MEKICIKCEETKNIKEFNKCRNNKNRLASYCKACNHIFNITPYEGHSSYTAYWIANNRERHNFNNRVSYHKRKVEFNATRRLRYLLNKFIG